MRFDPPRYAEATEFEISKYTYTGVVDGSVGVAGTVGNRLAFTRGDGKFGGDGKRRVTHTFCFLQEEEFIFYL